MVLLDFPTHSLLALNDYIPDMLELKGMVILRAYPEISRALIVPQIFCQTRRFFAGGLTPGKENQRSMAENMRHEQCAGNFGIGSYKKPRSSVD